MSRIAKLLVATLAITVVAAPGCAPFGARDDLPGVSDAGVRAARRAYDGAPPVIPHEDFGMVCAECHSQRGVAVRDVGYAPPSPHALTEGMSALSRCRQCHVFRHGDTLFAASGFVGLRQDLRRGARLNPLSPPTIPHRMLMRENCSACHTGAAAREEIRTSHPERIRCRQCHLPISTRTTFSSGFGPGS